MKGWGETSLHFTVIFLIINIRNHRVNFPPHALFWKISLVLAFVCLYFEKLFKARNQNKDEREK